MINEKKFLLKLWKEMGEALDYMPENSPQDYAFCVPYSTLCNRLGDLGATDKELGITRPKDNK